jgi:phage virion morphogenesis protein
LSGLRIEFDTSELEHTIGEMAERVTNRKPAMEAIGALAREAVKTNFAAGGRPARWKPVKHRDGQPLRDTGRLMNSIGKRVEGNTVYVGTNVVYAAVHHFGAKMGSFGTVVQQVKAHQRQVTQAFGKQLKFPVWATVPAHARKVAMPWGNIPARPFMLLQDEDVVEIKELLETWIMEGKI